MKRVSQDRDQRCAGPCQAVLHCPKDRPGQLQHTGSMNNAVFNYPVISLEGSYL